MRQLCILYYKLIRNNGFNCRILSDHKMFPIRYYINSQFVSFSVLIYIFSQYLVFFSISSKFPVNVFVGSFVYLLLSNVRIVKMNEKANERKYISFHTISRFVYISCFGSTRGQQNKADQYLR